MASSRIFIKGLPPTLSGEEFKRHFSQNSGITDAKIFPNRRIGYVGYKTPEDAQKAVKYFNKSFIRMSRIVVEIARPVQDASGRNQHASPPTAKKASSISEEANGDSELKRKRNSNEDEEQDPKLKEFLDVMRPKSKKQALDIEGQDAIATDDTAQDRQAAAALAENPSDDEYEQVPRKAKKSAKARDRSKAEDDEALREPRDLSLNSQDQEGVNADSQDGVSHHQQSTVSDSDWARSRTSRLLGLLDDDEEEDMARERQDEVNALEFEAEAELQKGTTKESQPAETGSSLPTPPSDKGADDNPKETMDGDVEAVRSSMRLFVRNLPYSVNEEDLEVEFEPYGNLEEVHIPLDKRSGSAKGFAYVQFSSADAAELALKGRDGQTFQGRLLHILPANTKRETKIDDFALSKLPLKKQQQIKKRREAASSTFNWNALYMNADAVVSSVADRLGISKSEVMDPTSSDAAIKQAHAETHIIQETKAYFKQHNVDLDAFKKSQRGDTAILVKNIPYDCSQDELKRLFEEHGEIKKFLMPPSGVIAIVEFANAAQCKTAFGALAYRKIKSSVLFLEKAPKGLFDGKVSTETEDAPANGVVRQSTSELKDQGLTVPDSSGSATLFVRNLDFSTTTPKLWETFSPLEGFLSARVKTKTDPKRPGEVLSMGFGFLEFRSSQQAQAALQAMDGYNLDGHKIQIRASHKGTDAAEERRRADAEKKAAGKNTKVVIKNLPFEATKKDVRSLFGAYGQLRSVRVPKKMDRAARGFAFADFTTPKEAESAMNALKNTHLLGRRLVLDFAAEDPEDAEAEIEKMQQKVGSQVNKVALQKLTSGGRKKFSTQNEEEADGN